MWGLPSSSTLYPGRNSLSWPLALGDTARGLVLQQCWGFQAAPLAALGASLSQGGMGEGEELL